MALTRGEKIWLFLKRYGQYLYWVVVVLMMAVFVFRARMPGIFLEGRFYKEVIQSQQTERIFQTKIDGKAAVMILDRSLPSDGAATFIYRQDGAQLWQWQMEATPDDPEGRNYTVILKNKDDTYVVEYDRFYKKTYITTNNDAEWYNTFLVQDRIESAVRAAFGEAETLGKDKLEAILAFLAAVGLAWLTLFRARMLFENRKAFEFSVRNREEMEPSDWYFFSTYASGVFLLIVGFVTYLYAVGVIQ